jgi:voltage-gated potassium channel
MSLYDMEEPLVAAPPPSRRRWRGCVCTRLGAYTVTTHGRGFMYGISGLILLNVAFAAFMTDDDQNGAPDDPAFARFYNFFEAFSTVVFTAEYLLRLWACVETPGGVESAWPPWLVGECARPPTPGAAGPQGGCGASCMLRLRWATNPTAIFDAVVCLAFWVDLMLEHWATEQIKGMGSTLRMFRIFQFAITILRLETQSPAFRRVAKVLTSSASELLLCLFLAGVLMVLGAVLIFFIEFQQVLGTGDNDQFDECGAEEGLMRARFKSLSRCIYWSAMTITTVGYGDMHPCTPAGQMIAVVWGFFGVAVVALPSGIIGSGLVDVMAEAKEKKAVAKKLAQTRATEAATAAHSGGAAKPTAEQMRDPARFHALGLAMLLPPGTVAATGGSGGRGSSNPLSLPAPGSPQSRTPRGRNGSGGGTHARAHSDSSETDHGGGGLSLMKRLEEAEAAGRDSPRKKGRRSGAGNGGRSSGGGGGGLSPRPGGGNGNGKRGAISPELQDERGQLNLRSESVIRGCAALLFPGEFVFDPSAERAASRGLNLAQGLGATTAAEIAGVQHALVMKLAREYLKARFRDGVFEQLDEADDDDDEEEEDDDDDDRDGEEQQLQQQLQLPLQEEPSEGLVRRTGLLATGGAAAAAAASAAAFVGSD